MSTTESTTWMGPLPAAPGCDCQICRPDEEGYDDLDRSVVDTVLEHGWQVMLIGDECSCGCTGGGSEEDGPKFAYTLGLGHRAAHPELVVSGLRPSVMHHLLNDVAAEVLAGRRLQPGDVLEGLLAGVPVTVERASDLGVDNTATWSGWFHRRQPEALVLVWPDKRSVFPWQPGAPVELDTRQPPGWRIPHEHTGALAPDPNWPFPVPPQHLALTCWHVGERGDSVRLVARQADAADETGEAGESWTVTCGQSHHVDDMMPVHLAHLVRGAPSLREVCDLALETEASRGGVGEPWVRAEISLE